MKVKSILDIYTVTFSLIGKNRYGEKCLMSICNPRIYNSIDEINEIYKDKLKGQKINIIQNKSWKQ